MSNINLDLDLLRRDECQPLTNEQVADIKSQFHPSNTANVQIIRPPYSPDEHIVTYWREYRDGVLMQKPVYEKTITGTTPSANGVIPNTSISDVDNPISIKVAVLDSNNTYEIMEGGYSTYVAIYFSKDSGVNVLYGNGGEFAKSRPTWVTLEYTKTSDEWQTV